MIVFVYKLCFCFGIICITKFSTHILLALRSLGGPWLAGLCSPAWKTNSHGSAAQLEGGCLICSTMHVYLICFVTTSFLND